MVPQNETAPAHGNAQGPEFQNTTINDNVNITTATVLQASWVYTARQLWDLGYRDLCSIVPPGAPIQPASSLVGKPTGKIPGWRKENGQWIGYDWLGKVSPAYWLAWWADWNCGTGIKPGAQPDGCNILAIDADTLDEARAAAIRAKVVEHFGLLPTRVGRAPKSLYLLRTVEPVRTFKLRFEDAPNADPAKPGAVGQIEMLGNGSQFVAAGLHATTLRPYVWTVPLVPIADLPVFTIAQIEAFLADIEPLLPKVGRGLKGFGGAEDRLSDYSNVDQADLRAPSLDMLAGAVRAIPNEPETTRDDYRNLGLALHAAAAQDLDFGRELFVEWATQWPGDTKGADLTANALSDWSRFKTPHLIGWRNYIRPKAEKAGWRCLDGFTFDDVGDEPKPDGKTADPEPKQKTKRVRRYGDATPTPPKWLIDKLVPQSGIGFIGGQYGAGKTYLGLDLSGSVMTGRDFAGRKVHRTGAVLWLAAEGESDVDPRMTALVEGKLRPQLGELMPERLPFYTNNEDVPLLTDEKTALPGLLTIVGEVKEDLAERFPGVELALIFIDTLAASAGFNDENAAGESQRVMNRLRSLSRQTGAVVLVADHYGKNADAGLRGSTTKPGAADVILAALVERDANTGRAHNRRMAVPKLRGGKTGDEFPWTLREDVPTDDLGNTNCVVDWKFGTPEPQAKAKKDWAGAGGKMLRAALSRVLTEHATEQQPFGVEGDTVDAVPFDLVAAEFRRAYPGDADAKRKALKRALDQAIKDGLALTRQIGSEGEDWVWLTCNT